MITIVSGAQIDAHYRFIMIDITLPSQLCRLDKGKKRIFEETFQHEIEKQFGVTSICRARKILKLATSGIATLHIAIETNDEKQIEATLNNSTDFITKNSNGHTAVVQHIKKDKLHYYKKVGCELQEFYALYKYRRKIRKCNSLMLFAHVKFHNPVNLSSKDFYDFRISCMLTNAKAVEASWNNQVFQNKTVNIDLKILQGYPSLHFAAKHSTVNCAKALLYRGAEINSKDAEGQTPLDILVAESMQLIDYIRMGKEGPFKKLVAKLERNKCIIEMILKVMSNSEKIVMKSLKNQKRFDKKLWIEVRKTSWQGCTSLPFSLYISVNIESARKRKSNGGTKETKVSVIRLRSFIQDFMKSSFDEEQSIWKNILFSDKKTSLAEFHAAMKDAQSFRNFIKKTDNYIGMIIPHNSPVFPGCTPLHLAIVFAAKMDYDNIIRTTFDFKNKSSNIRYNYIGLPRHVYINMIKHCLELGSDVTASDNQGTTPLQLAEKLFGGRVVMLLQQFHTQSADISDVKTNSTRKRKSDPNYSTILHSTVHEKVLKLRTALATKSYNTTDLQTAMDTLHKEHPESFYQVIEEFTSKINCGNMTPLHAACCKLDLINVVKCLVFEDINVQTKSTNAFWAGYSSLHFLTMKRGTFDMDKLISIARLLLEKGADVTLKNAHGFTPLHQALDNIFVLLPAHQDKKRVEFLNILLSGHRDTNVNPTDSRGISHFHIACICNRVDLVENFVTSGVDINKKINDHSNIFIGFSPLHLAASYKSKETVDLLLNVGADIHARNQSKNTPLHEAVNYLNYSQKFGCEERDDEVIRYLVSAGADIAADNSFGQIPLEILMETKTLSKESFEMLLKDPSCVNIFNRITGVGLIGTAMMYTYDVENLKKHPVYESVISNPKRNQADANGRTPIHNIVAMRNYSNQFTLFKLPSCDVLNEAIKSFINLGFKVDQQDNEGQTALHIAAKFFNVPAIETLLSLGSNINITDVNGLTPPSNCLKRCGIDTEFELSNKSLEQISAYKKNCLNAFFNHIKRIKLNGYQINQINEEVYFQLQKEIIRGDKCVNKTNQLKQTNKTMDNNAAKKYEKNAVQKNSSDLLDIGRLLQEM